MNMNQKAVPCFISLGLLLAGCAADPTVLDNGNGRLSVTGSSERGTPYAREDAHDLANAHCAQSGKKPTIESFDDKDAGYQEPKSSMVFRCD
jgi:hypothetical protein